MKHVLSALCNRVLIDEMTQTVTLVDLIDSLLGPIDPDSEGAFPVALDFLTIWLRDDLQKPETGRGRLGIKNATGVLIHPYLEYEVDLTSIKKARNITRFPGFPFKGVGMHTIIIDAEAADGEWKRVAEWPMLISGVSPGVLSGA
jgi:hypothetical protein